MIENIKGVRNPLTIIAIFAGLAEISGTGILPFIEKVNQATYIWFLMIFPAVLVFLFFLTLNFNPKVLYSPSDFRDETNYMRIFEPSSAAQKLIKIQEEVLEESEATKPIPTDRQLNVISSQAEIAELLKKDPGMRYRVAENLVIDKLTRELRIQPQREMSLRNKSTTVMFDAIFQRPDGITVVEVRVVSREIPMSRILLSIVRIQRAFQELPKDVQKKTHFILAVVYDMSEEYAKTVKRELESNAMDSDIPVEVRMFFLPDLLKELEIQ